MAACNNSPLLNLPVEVLHNIRRHLIGDPDQPYQQTFDVSTVQPESDGQGRIAPVWLGLPLLPLCQLHQTSSALRRIIEPFIYGRIALDFTRDRHYYRILQQLS
ncbi:hypothetical protein QBC44DRAFT_367531 [Cladorrhinum sp. PSN332]|nr:hypothetical protein QBC44DRAFT_367531 [Cladorrhinum sp. PSN332]